MKFTGRYTAATAKALKGSPRLVCQVTEDGTIYVCNGFLLCTMNPPEYAPAVQADKPGEYVYCYEMQQAPTGCDFAADLSYYGKHYFLRPLRDDLPQLHGRGISYDEERNTYTVTTRAYDKLKEQYRIRYETCLD